MADCAENFVGFQTLLQFMTLDQGNSVQAEYVWLGGAKLDLRSKTRTLDANDDLSVDKLPVWNYDGSSTGQADGHDSEVLLKPVRVYRDPFRRGKNLLVLCATHDKNGKPTASNARDAAKALFDKNLAAAPWFGIEQEYAMFNSHGRPLGWPTHPDAYPAPQGPYYCAVGANVSFGRAIVEAHYRACLYAGVKIAGVNAEVMPGQWEYQIGPCEGIQSGDDTWMARYLMGRVAEMWNVTVSFHPKPITLGDWNGSGCHTNYSTAPMRAANGYGEIIKAIEKLGKKHKEHIELYGADNHLRLTGKHETASIDKFSYGVADRGSSIRIPRSTEAEQRGYLEDRRPASNMDPYVVTGKIFQTTVIDE